MTWRGLLEDLTDSVSDTFGEPVTYWRAGSAEPIEIVAIFDPEFHEQSAGGGVGVSSAVSILDIRDRDIGGPPRGEDRARVDGVDYVVRSTIPSTSGMTKAVLRRRR